LAKPSEIFALLVQKIVEHPKILIWMVFSWTIKGKKTPIMTIDVF
jgi:hypothetical protein